jgi:RNA polymerase sigma-70 factor (ECF subfamily)
MPIPQTEPGPAGDAALVARIRAGDEDAVRTLVRRNNQRLFRVARSILRDDAEAEDAVQEAYVRAFTHLDSFRGEALLSTWLTRIVVNEALGRLRSRRPMTPWMEDIVTDGDGQVVPFPLISPQPDPERSMAQHEIKDILERAIDALPDPFRVVLVARVLEEMSVEETAALFGLRPETVKTRLHRARDMLRRDVEQQLGPMLAQSFPFAGARCERMAENVVMRLRELR